MSSSRFLAIVALVSLVCSVAGQYDYQTKNYNPPQPSGATTCVKGIAGNTPALCPVDKGVPLTDEGKSGSTTCVTGVTGKSVEGVISLMYPAPNAVPWCTKDSDCGSNPGVICAASGPNGSGNMCFPLAPSTCPFPASDSVNTSTTAVAGRRLLMA